jgi:carbon monoxide dehydrogenase subunit G
VKLQVSAVLPGGPERVWDVVADWRRYPAWMPDVSWVRRISGEAGVGLELDVRTKVLGVPFVTDRMRVTAWDPPRRMAIQHEGLVSGPADWRLEPAGEDGTRFLWTEELRMPPPLIGEIGLWLYRPVLRLTFRWSMRNLAKLVREG